MGFGLFFLVLAAGYLVLRFDPQWRFFIARDSGYHILFKSALVGLVFGALARASVMAANAAAPSLGTGWKLVAPDPYSGTVALSLALAALTVMARRRFPPSASTIRDQARRSAAQDHDHFELLVDEALGAGPESIRLIELTLESRKVYVGFILQSDPPVGPRLSVKMIPILSGFRDEVHLGVQLTHNYARTLDMHPEQLARAEHLSVIIPSATIRSARLFDAELYRRFAEDEGRSDASSAAASG